MDSFVESWRLLSILKSRSLDRFTWFIGCPCLVRDSEATIRDAGGLGAVSRNLCGLRSKGSESVMIGSVCIEALDETMGVSEIRTVEGSLAEPSKETSKLK